MESIQIGGCQTWESGEKKVVNANSQVWCLGRSWYTQLSCRIQEQGKNKIENPTHVEQTMGFEQLTTKKQIQVLKALLGKLSTDFWLFNCVKNIRIMTSNQYWSTQKVQVDS